MSVRKPVCFCLVVTYQINFTGRQSILREQVFFKKCFHLHSITLEKLKIVMNFVKICTTGKHISDFIPLLGSHLSSCQKLSFPHNIFVQFGQVCAPLKIKVRYLTCRQMSRYKVKVKRIIKQLCEIVSDLREDHSILHICPQSRVEESPNLLLP